MSVTIYPAVLKTDDTATGAAFWDAIAPMQGSAERLTEAAKNANGLPFEGEPFERNPDYIPFSSMDMSSGNVTYLIGMIGLDAGDESYGNLPIQDVFVYAHNYLFPHGGVRFIVEAHIMERVFALREIARFGIARGATHIVWA